MLSTMLLSRFLTLQEYGDYSQLILVSSMATILFMMGLPASINYFVARADDEQEKQRFLSMYQVLTTGLSIIVGVLLVLGLPFFASYFHNPQLYRYLFFFALYPWHKIVMSSVENMLVVYNKTNYSIAFKLANGSFLLGIIFVSQILKINFQTYLLIYIIVESIFTGYVYILTRQVAGKLYFVWDTKLLKKILAYSVPIGLATVLSYFNIQLDTLIIGKFYSAEQLAIYANAARELPLTIIPSAVTVVLMPQLVRLFKRGRDKDAMNLWGESIYISYALMCFFAVALIMYAPSVISLLYSEKYLPGVNVFRVYSALLLIRFTYFGIILNSIGKTKFVFYSSLFSFLLNMVLNYLFYLQFGYIGPSIATFIALLVIQVAQLILTARTTQTKFKDLMPWNTLLKITVLNFAIGIVFFYLKQFIPLEKYVGDIGESLLLGAVWTLVYGTIMFKRIRRKWKALNSEEYV
jgi:O-antigen/teichoic acid export membrane protein